MIPPPTDQRRTPAVCQSHEGAAANRAPYADVVSTPADPPPPHDTVGLGDFAAPTALPSPAVRASALVAVVVAALCGGLMGLAAARLQWSDDSTMGQLGGVVIGSAVTALGTAIVSVLVLRAMSEWQDQAPARAR